MIRALMVCAVALSTGIFAAEPKYGVSEDALVKHVSVLGSDLMQGRRAGSNGYRQGVEYAASVLANAQVGTLFSVAEKVTFLQIFEIPVSHVSPPMRSFNVVGVVEGRDAALRDQYVVIGAHIDGLGIGGWLLGEGQTPGVIHNGANDNATGVAVTLELARYFAKSPPKRSIVFGLWSAEEIGRFGAKHFIANSPFDLQNVVAHINLDGVGRSDRVSKGKPEIYALGAGLLCSELEERMDEANSKTAQFHLNKEDKEGWYQYSDHYEFHLAGVPSVFLTDLGSDDYHKPADDSEKIDPEQLAKVAEFALALTEDVANSEKRICQR